MRDLLVVVLVFGSLPLILQRPFFGIIVWTWLGLMNPHALTWGFARTLPVAQIVLLTFLASYMLSKESKKIPLTREVFLLGLFILWMLVTTVFALADEPAWAQFIKVCKIQIGIVLTIMLTTTRERIDALVWVVVMSLGFYGIKGGIFVLLTGGAHMVLGPIGTFIEGNNELGLAMIMIVPLLWYLRNNIEKRWLRLGVTGALFLTVIAIIGTHSRGALLGLVAMSVVMILKSRKKLLAGVIAFIIVAMAPLVMPDAWFDRMRTIETYTEDQSAVQRLRAWGTAIDYARNRITGGGFQVMVYYEEFDAHSIYFEVLCEHGFVGLGIFLLLAAFTWFKANWIRRKSQIYPDLKWAADLMAMAQVSMVGYGAAGAFLGLAYFDLIYIVMALVIVTYQVTNKQLESIVEAPVNARLAPT